MQAAIVHNNLFVLFLLTFDVTTFLFLQKINFYCGSMKCNTKSHI